MVEPQSNPKETDNKKRLQVKQLIERYFYQLSIGCGNTHCTNENCASFVQFKVLTPNEAAARAIELFSENSKFCEFFSKKSLQCNVNGTKTFFEPVAEDSLPLKCDDGHR